MAPQELAAYESEVLTDVGLSPAKVTSTNARTTEVECIDLQATKTVAATVGYDSTRHLSVKMPVESVVEH